jgi:hypothetical protein
MTRYMVSVSPNIVVGAGLTLIVHLCLEFHAVNVDVPLFSCMKKDSEK